MRLIEKSLTENIYNALNESFDSDKATKRVARYKKSNRVRMNESDKYYVSFSSGELNMDVPFNNDKIKRDVIKGKGGKGPDGVETDLVRYIGTKEDLEKLMDKDFDGEYKNNIKKLDESEEAQLNDLYNASKVEWDDLSGSDQTAVEYFSSNFGDNIANKSWDEVESDIIEACYEIGYANEELINNGYWNDGDMDPEPDKKKVTEYIFQNYFLPKKNSKNIKESTYNNVYDYVKANGGDMDVPDNTVDGVVCVVTPDSQNSWYDKAVVSAYKRVPMLDNGCADWYKFVKRYYNSFFKDEFYGSPEDIIEDDTLNNMFAGGCSEEFYKRMEIALTGTSIDDEVEDMKESKKLDESFDVNKVAKRIARYKEPDEHVFHSWYEELSPDKAEEMARQASIENPEDVFYVQYDDVMNSSSEYRYVNGVQYNINKGGFHYVNGLPKFHTDADWQAVSKKEKTWEEIDAMKESVGSDKSAEVANFIKDSVEKLQTTDYTNCKYNLDDKLAIYVGWSDGYDAEETSDLEIHSKKNPTYAINVVIGVRNDADYADLDYITIPYYETDGEAYNCQYTVSHKEDYTYLADSLLKAYEDIKSKLESGELLTESAEIDNDKDNYKLADMVMELHGYVEAEPSKISRDLKAAIKSNKLEDYLKHSAAMDDEEISNFIKKYSGETNNIK